MRRAPPPVATAGLSRGRDGYRAVYLALRRHQGKVIHLGPHELTRTGARRFQRAALASHLLAGPTDTGISLWLPETRKQLMRASVLVARHCANTRAVSSA